VGGRPEDKPRNPVLLSQTDLDGLAFFLGGGSDLGRGVALREGVGSLGSCSSATPVLVVVPGGSGINGGQSDSLA